MASRTASPPPSPAPSPAAPRGALDRYFRITERGSSVGQEFRGGLATFLAMSYIVVLNPLILSGPDSAGNTLGIPAVAAVTALVAQVLGGADGGRLDRLKRRQSCADQQGELLSVVAVCRDAGVGAERDPDAVAVGLAGGVLDFLPGALGARLRRGRQAHRVVADAAIDGARGSQPGPQAGQQQQREQEAASGHGGRMIRPCPLMLGEWGPAGRRPAPVVVPAAGRQPQQQRQRPISCGGSDPVAAQRALTPFLIFDI